MKSINTVKTILAAAAFSLSLNVPVLAQQYHLEREECFNKHANLRGRIEYDICTPPPLGFAERRKSNAVYTQYMGSAVDAAAEKNDYDTAMINFKRAAKVADTKYRYSEAFRGYKAAALAKHLKEHPYESKGVTPYVGWVYISGIQSSRD